MILLFVIFMAGSFGEEPSSRSKQRVETSREPGVHDSFNQEDFKIEDFQKQVIVYENQVDVKNLESHFVGFQGLVQTQCWEIAFISTLEKKIAFPQIREFYHTLVKVNEWYYKAKLNGQTFHPRSGNLARL